jgi:hypothetical protein
MERRITFLDHSFDRNGEKMAIKVDVSALEQSVLIFKKLR